VGALYSTTTLADAGPSPGDLARLSLQELTDINVTSVSKRAEPLLTAPAAIYVITSDDILNSSATSVPEMLQLAPNLQVAQSNSYNYAITARGFNSTLANKLLVLIDGRSVYSPLFGGVYWDMQQVMRGDIQQIEVIRGPGATLWGANAFNGVINITSRNSADTQGGLTDVFAGSFGRGVDVRYGGRISDDLTYRVYVSGLAQDATKTANGLKGEDNWAIPQGGFRADWHHDNDLVTVQGDAYDGYEKQPGNVAQSVAGQNVLARWTHSLDGGSNLQIQTYFDRAHRFDTGGLTVDTVDFDLQHSIPVGNWNELVWGGGYRFTRYWITNVPTFQIQPPKGTLNLGNFFGQDTIALSKSLKVTVGLKLEDDPYSGLSILPSGRVSWQIDDTAMIWSAVSKAIRAPTPYDRNVVEKVGSTVFLTGGTNFKSEKLAAYEIGVRLQPMSGLSLSVSGFYNVYDDLRSIEVSPVTGFIPVNFANLMAGDSYGVESWLNYRPLDWWELAAGFNIQHEALRFKPGSSGLGGTQQAGNDPSDQFSIRSTISLSHGIQLEADLRYVGALPNPAVPAYVEANGRLAWAASERLEISIAGSNLIHRQHLEFGSSTDGNEIPRSVFAEARWKF